MSYSKPLGIVDLTLRGSYSKPVGTVDLTLENINPVFFVTGSTAIAVALAGELSVAALSGSTAIAVTLAGDVEMRLATEHAAGWNRALVAEHAAGWRALVALVAEHAAGWATNALVAEHAAGWSIGPLVAEHAAGWALVESVALAAEHAAGWALVESAALAAEHAAGWAVRAALVAEHAAGWRVALALALEHAAGWAIIDPAFLVAEHAAGWAAVDRAAVVTAPAPFLRAGDRLVPIRSATVSASEGSPYWRCEIELAHAADYRLLPRDAAIELDLFGAAFAFLVDSRELSRSMDAAGNPERRATVAGLSPVCRYAEPRALAFDRIWTEPASARSIVEELLGRPVDWRMVDWWIPGHRLAVQGGYPLDVARKLVEAAGGLLESAPDGGVLARPKWPVSAPDLAAASAEHALDDRVVFAVSDRPGVDARVNRVRIADVEGAYRDGLEWIADEADPLRGALRAYPSPWRDGLTLRHTRGSPPIYLDAATAATETLTEIVEFAQGRASVRRPVATLGAVTWLADDLGGVAHAAGSTELIAAVAAYSLAEVRYATRYLTAPGRASAPTKAQFLLEDLWLE